MIQVRLIAAQALTTVAIRSGEPYRLQIYDFLHSLAQGGLQSQFSEMHLSNGEDQGASGTGLGVLISPMIKVLDEMYRAQDDLIKYNLKHFPSFFSLPFFFKILIFISGTDETFLHEQRYSLS